MKKVNKMVYALLAIFLGGLGIHKFYAGKPIMGIVFIALDLVFGLGALVGLVEGIVALTKQADADGMIEITESGFWM